MPCGPQSPHLQSFSTLSRAQHTVHLLQLQLQYCNGHLVLYRLQFFQGHLRPLLQGPPIFPVAATSGTPLSSTHLPPFFNWILSSVTSSTHLWTPLSSPPLRLQGHPSIADTLSAPAALWTPVHPSSIVDTCPPQQHCGHLSAPAASTAALAKSHGFSSQLQPSSVAWPQLNSPAAANGHSLNYRVSYSCKKPRPPLQQSPP